MLPDDPEESVRICYANNISKLALTAYAFLIHSISLSEAGVLNESNSSNKSPFTEASGRLKNLNSDAQLAQLRKSIAEVIQELVMGPKQTPNIRRAPCRILAIYVGSLARDRVMTFCCPSSLLF